ncbi:MAG: MATE family efflux transporter [Allobaculum sp.]|uniref:MATE family efflux transporter n=1 Tax=Allobaculum sp. TaxID=1872463 RepID=UPI00399BDA9D
MTNTLAQHYSIPKLLRFTLPTILVMVFTSIYGVVDGYFLSSVAGKTAFAAVNFIMPVLMILASFDFMMGAGSSALVGKTLGEQNPQKARKQMTSLLTATVILGMILSVLGLVFLRPLLEWMDCSEQMMPYALQYGSILQLSLPLYIIQMYFQSIFVTAGIPQAGFAVTFAGGMLNIVQDVLFVGVLGWGAPGAAIATALGQLLCAALSILCFLSPAKKPFRLKEDKVLYFTASRIRLKEFGQAALNGISELFSNCASSLISILYNYQLMRFAGEDGVAVYGT